MQANLFGEPQLKPALSQWHTPPWLAKRAAHWIPNGARVVEPSCGGGNLIQALMGLGHDPRLIVGVELDVEWADRCRARDPRLAVHAANFLDLDAWWDGQPFDAVLSNPPFEDELHTQFVIRALELAPIVVAIVPASFEFGQGRDSKLWASRGVVTRRARMPARVDFGGDSSGKGDTVCLRIERRTAPRLDGDVMNVREEVWLP